MGVHGFRGEPCLVPGLPLPDDLHTRTTAADAVGSVRHDTGHRGDLPLPGAGGLSSVRWIYTFRSAPPGGGFHIVLPARSVLYWYGDGALATVRRRRPDQSHARLRYPERDARGGLFRGHHPDAKSLHRSNRPGEATTIRHRRLHAGHRRPVRPAETAHPILYRQALLPQEIRRE